MLKIYIINLIMLIITMVKFIITKATMAQLIMVKLIMLNQLSWLKHIQLKKIMVKLTIIIEHD